MFATKDLPRHYQTIFFGTLAFFVLSSFAGRILPSTSVANGVWLVALFGIIFMPMIQASFVRASAKTVAPTSRSVTVESPLDADSAFAKLSTATLDRCKIVDSDRARGVLVLSSPMRGASWGFLYPVFVRAKGTGSSIEVGILPKAIQHVSTVAKWNESCAAEVTKALAA